MDAAAVVAAAPAVDEPVLVRLQEMQCWLAGLVDGRDTAGPVADAVRVDRIALIERLQAGLEAVKSVEIVAFARSRAVAQVEAGVSPRQAERGIAEEIALACRVSPTEGSRRLHTARDLVLDLPNTLTLLTSGDLHAGTVRRVTDPLSHLDRANRRHVDGVLGGVGLAALSPRQTAAAATRAAHAADPAAATARARHARTDRRVTLRPAPDTMTLLTGLLPVEQGVACLAALRDAVRRAHADGDPRSRGQIMADTLVARLTGQEHAEDVGFEVGIVLPVGSLLDPDDPTPADIPGHGSLPAGLLRELLTNAQARSWWRRLFTRPTRSGGQLVVDLDQRRRRFGGWLAELIRWRDWTCRDPYCDAPIRHIDHIQQHRHGGHTTSLNGRGVCERGNYIRELPGWTVRLLDPDDHTVVTVTPTGHRYVFRPPEPP